MTSVARDAAGLDGAGQLTAVRGLRPLVAVELARDDGVDRRLGLARPVGAEHVEVDPRVEVLLAHHRLVPGRHAGDDVAGQRLLARTRAPAAPSSSASASATSARGSKQTPVA